MLSFPTESSMLANSLALNLAKLLVEVNSTNSSKLRNEDKEQILTINKIVCAVFVMKQFNQNIDDYQVVKQIFEMLLAILLTLQNSSDLQSSDPVVKATNSLLIKLMSILSVNILLLAFLNLLIIQKLE